ncbi:hypothetical protein BD413DRAFT_596242 [Trametes elegans]|nr:hypothetical protein BD413DRAFT_596242 [Trametes elegans]
MPIHICYHHLVLNYFNPVALLSVTWSLRVSSKFANNHGERVSSSLVYSGRVL